MDISTIFPQLQGVSLLDLFIKAFALLFSFLYLIYAIVISRQTRVMNETVRVSGSGIISLISFIQILVGLVLVALAIFLV